MTTVTSTTRKEVETSEVDPIQLRIFNELCIHYNHLSADGLSKTAKNLAVLVRHYAGSNVHCGEISLPVVGNEDNGSENNGSENTGSEDNSNENIQGYTAALVYHRGIGTITVLLHKFARREEELPFLLAEEAENAVRRVLASELRARGSIF